MASSLGTILGVNLVTPRGVVAHTEADSVQAPGVWDPATNMWTMLPVMQKKRWYPTVTLLGNNQVMVSGGVEDTFNDTCYKSSGFVPDGALSFRLLNGGPHAATLAAIPVLTFAAPFIIMRNTIRGRRVERRRFQFVMLATILAGFWSMLSGTLVMMALRACGVLQL